MTIKGSFFEIRAAVQGVRAAAPGQTVAEVLIFDRIGKDIFGESVDAADFVKALAEIEADVIVCRINSPGGSVPDGIAIHNALRRHSASIEISIEGMAVSIASMIAMAGDTITMADNALFMMHAPWAMAVGNSKRMRQFADVLDKHAEAMATAYTRVVEDKADDVRAMLTDGDDHWFTAAEARDFGFVSEVTETVPAEACFDLSHIQQDHIPAAAAAFMGKPPAARKPAAKPAAPIPTAASAAKPQELTMNWKTLAKALGLQIAADADDATIRAQVQQHLKLEASATDDAIMAAAVKREQDADNSAVIAQMKEQETQRRQDIRAAFDKFSGYMGVTALRDECLDDMGITAETARNKLLAKLGEGATPLSTAAEAATEAGMDERDKRIEAKTQALLARAGIKDDKGQLIRADGANPYRGLPLGEMARASFAEAGVQLQGGVAEFAHQVLAAGPHTTSDFKVVLENTMHKLLMSGFLAYTPTYSRVCKIGTVSDFREYKRLVPALVSGLDKKDGESGEYRNKAIDDAQSNAVAAEERGNIISVDRRVLINDDLDYIVTLLRSIGMAAARGIDKDFWTLLASNPVLKSDATPLFHADHGNLAASGGAPSVATLAAGRKAMALQKSPGDSSDFLDISPAVAAAGIEVAEDIRVIVDSQYDPDAANKLQRPNKVRGLVGDVVGTPRIAGNAWYLFANPEIAPVFEVVFLNGQQEPRLLQEENFNTGSFRYRPTLDYGIGAIDYRGTYKDPGAA